MPRIFYVASAILFFLINAPFAKASQARPKTLSGIVTGTSGSQIFFRASSAALYAAEVGSAKLVRKYGASMQMDEVLVGDKVEVKGFVWSDNSISASYFRDLSLYAHDSTFAGKVTGIDPSSGSFTLQSKQYGTQTIFTEAFTTFKNNGQTSSFSQVELGVNETVKGVWERSYANVSASSVVGVTRLVSIQITGTLTAKNGSSLTVTADNVIYGVDTAGAKVENNHGAASDVLRYNLGDTIRVDGKHLSQEVAIKASVVKDLSASN